MRNTLQRKIFLFLLAFNFLLSGFSVTGLAAENTSTAVSFSISPITLSLKQGGSQPLFTNIIDDKGNYLTEPVTWTSSNELIATVDNGLVTAISPGNVEITATLDSNPALFGSCTIIVEPSDSNSIAVQLRIEGVENTILENTSVTLTSTTVTDKDGNSHDYGMFTPYGALVKELNERSISYEGAAFASPYVSSINGIDAQGWNGWQYKIIRDGKIESSADSYGMSNFSLMSGDQILVYYAPFGIHPLASVHLDKTYVDVNDPITVTVTNLIDDTSLEGTTVHFGENEVITDEQGMAQFTPLTNGIITIFADRIGESPVIRSDRQQIFVGPVEKSLQQLLEHYRGQGLPSSEWEIIGLNALGEDANRSPYVSSIGRFFAQDLRNKDSQNMGDLAKYILAILSLGYNPGDFDDRNYVQDLLQKEIELINEAIYALIAIDAAKVNSFENTAITRDDLITYILENRVQNGWSLDTNALKADPDLTAMALIALAPYKDEAQIKPIVNQAVTALQQLQKEDGGFEEGVTDQLNSQSAAQVIQALTALGIDPQGPDFTKANGENPVNNLLSYQLADGSFGNLKVDIRSNSMATEQALNALAALRQFAQSGISTHFQNITYSGGTVPDLQGHTKSFSITSIPLEMDGGLLSASVTVNPINGGHDGKEVVVFQLMNNNQPWNIFAVKKDITAPEEVTAYFNVQQGSFKVKVFLLDSLTGSDELGQSLSDIKILE